MLFLEMATRLEETMAEIFTKASCPVVGTLNSPARRPTDRKEPKSPALPARRVSHLGNRLIMQKGLYIRGTFCKGQNCMGIFTGVPGGPQSSPLTLSILLDVDPDEDPDPLALRGQLLRPLSHSALRSSSPTCSWVSLPRCLANHVVSVPDQTLSFKSLSSGHD